MKGIILIASGLVLGLSGWCQTSRQSFTIPSSDYVVVPASTRYDGSFLRKFFTGANYRDEWQVPVKMPVFDLKKSGLVITKLGGGQQTRSLRLKDKNGREWVLRTIDKFVEGALPPHLRNTLAEKVVQDMVSAAYPYGALVVASLAQSGGIVASDPVLYFVPDTEALGEYRKEMGNQVCFLEERDPVPNPKESEDTEDLIEKRLEEHDNIVLQKKVLRARLLDMLVADWDRHEDQWSWGEVDSAGSNYYFAVPRDRDQAFFISGGLIPRIGKAFGMRHINHFKKNSRNLKDLSYKAWNFDKLFLNSLDENDWKTVIAEMQAYWNDAAIEAAVHSLPPEVYAISGESMTSKLKSRRDGLMKNALKYYRFISARTNITGSNENELFKITGSGKNLMVSVYKLSEGNKQGDKIFERVFDPAVTGSITISGLKGDDHFQVDESASSRIRLKIYGDKGNDVYNIRGNTRSTVYDAKSDSNEFMNLGSAKIFLQAHFN